VHKERSRIEVGKFMRSVQVAIFCLLSCAAFAVPGERAILVREATIYLTPDTASAKMAKAERGREVVIIEKSREYLHVLGMLGQGREITGWILDKGVIRTSTPNGDKILFGEASDSEADASRRGGRRGADKDAARLYARLAEYFPKSEYAGEAAWRAADVQWQLGREEMMSRKSAKERDAYMRAGIDEDAMREVIKKFPNTKWADLAAWDMIDNKLCGDWQGSAKCPEKESEIYEDYIKKYPNSPKVGEAQYAIAWRQATLVDIYRANADLGKSASAKTRAMSLAQALAARPNEPGDWPARGQRLLYLLQEGIPIYGTSLE
jgi:hypothetical protein